jgi:hypothetical protein
MARARTLYLVAKYYILPVGKYNVLPCGKIPHLTWVAKKISYPPGGKMPYLPGGEMDVDGMTEIGDFPCLRIINLNSEEEIFTKYVYKKYIYKYKGEKSKHVNLKKRRRKTKKGKSNKYC